MSVFPPDHWRSFVDPDRLGHPAYKDWSGDRRLGPLNNYTETTVYLGLLTIPLALLGIFRRRCRARWFWLGMCAVVRAGLHVRRAGRCCMARGETARIQVLRACARRPAAAACRSAIWPRRARGCCGGRSSALLLAVLIAYDLASGGRALLSVPRAEACRRTGHADGAVPAQRAAARSAWRRSSTTSGRTPSELVRVEDVRSHFGSERDYRRMLLRLDPTSWSGTSTVLTFNSLKYNFNDPLNALLGVRWFIEHNHIDIIKWGDLLEHDGAGREADRRMQFKPGALFERTVRVDAEPFWAIEFPVDVIETRGRESAARGDAAEAAAPRSGRGRSRANRRT